MRMWTIAVALVATSLHAVAAERIGAALETCPKASVMPASIGGDIALGVIDSLLGGVIDSLVRQLGTDQVERYSTILPVDEVALLFDGTNCLRVRSVDGQTKRGFDALFGFKSVGTALRPAIIAWQYPHDPGAEFLTDRCRLFHSCNRRDVGVLIEVLGLASGFGASTVASTPLDITLNGVTATEVHDAFNGANATRPPLPWVSRPEMKGPANLRFTLLETMQASAFSKALSGALASQKSAILAKVGSKLDGTADQVAAQATLQDIDAATKAQAEYVSAWRAATATVAAFGAATSDADKASLRATYLLQLAQVNARRTLARAAFSVAGLATPDELGALPAAL